MSVNFLGPLTPLWDLAGVMVAEMKNDIEEQLNATQHKELETAKLEGLEATKKYISATKHIPEYQDSPLDIIKVSRTTATKLIYGEFKTYKQFSESLRSDRDIYNGIFILIREVENKNRKGYANHIIESIFINE